MTMWEMGDGMWEVRRASHAIPTPGKEHLMQLPLLSPLEELSPSAKWDRDTAGRALDELFSLARQYKSSKAYFELLGFIGRFRFYSPFNAMLVHIQMPGAIFVAPPSRWRREYRREIKAGARPLVILQPMGPVMFVFISLDCVMKAAGLIERMGRERLEPRKMKEST